jgi:hypothetical protein
VSDRLKEPVLKTGAPSVQPPVGASTGENTTSISNSINGNTASDNGKSHLNCYKK